MKSKLFMELPCSINTQVENKRGENKKDMAHCMLIHLSIFGRPQEDYKQFFVGGRMCQSWKTRQPQVPKALGRSHSFLPPTQLLDNWGGLNQGCVTYGIMVRVPSGQESFLSWQSLPLTLSILTIISIPFPLPTVSFMLQHQG